MLKFLFTAIFLGLFLSSFAQVADPYAPKFNYAIFAELKDKGVLDANGKKTGKWIEYTIDSTDMKQRVSVIDEGRNTYPPYSILLVKSIGEYVNGKKNGIWTYYKTYDSKAPLKWDLMETVTLVDDVYTGPWKYYYTSGKVMDETSYSNGEVHGIYNHYDQDGVLRETTNYSKGVAEGRAENFSRTGVCIWSADMHEGFYHGIENSFYHNGQLRTSIEYKNGRPWNMTEAYARTGAPLDKGTLKDGTGVFFEYNEGGSYAGSIELVQGVSQGWKRSYYPNGHIMFEAQYHNDSMNGMYKSYYEEGGLEFEGPVINGLLEGLVKNYYKNGKLQSENMYRKGEVWAAVSAKGLNGENLNCGNLKMGTGVWISYDDTARISSKEKFSFGIREGLHEHFFPDGKVKVTWTYKWDLPEEYRAYYPSGQLKAMYHFKEGMLHGTGMNYYPNGKTNIELYHYRGRLWQVISMADSTGRKMKIGNFKNGTGVINYYTEDGYLSSTVEMLHGFAQGKETRYYRNGKKGAELQYFQDSLRGQQKEYWENGKLAVVSWRYENGRTQDVVQYHSNGKPWTTWKYEEGFLWEVLYNYDINGKPHDVGTFAYGSGSVFRYDEKDSVIFTYNFLNGKCLNCASDTVTLLLD